jgi:hypothetical protein
MAGEVGRSPGEAQPDPELILLSPALCKVPKKLQLQNSLKKVNHLGLQEYKPRGTHKMSDWVSF